MKKDYDNMSQSEKSKEDWLNTKWRPMMGWVYMFTCIADFVIFPMLWSVLQAVNHGQIASQWQPITLQGAGLFHMSMGIIIGVSAYGRTQEKINGVYNEPWSLSSTGRTTFMPQESNVSSQYGDNYSPNSPSVSKTNARSEFNRNNQEVNQPVKRSMAPSSNKPGPDIIEPEL